VAGYYLVLKSSTLFIRLKIKAADGKNLADAVDISTVNLFLHSLFEHVEIYIGSTLVSSKTNYHYSAYLLTHLSLDENYKKDILRNALYVADVGASTISDTNSGYQARKQYIRGSKSLELIGPIYDDVIYGQDRYILPNVNVRIKLKRSPTKFCLLSPLDTTDYKIEFEEAVFMVKKHLVSPTVTAIHDRQLSQHKALYPYTLNQIKTVNVSQNSISAVFENLFSSSKLPQVLLIGFVDADAYNGKLSRNPYNFEAFDVTNVNVSIDQVSYEYTNLNINFSSKYLIAFQNLLTGLNLENKSVGINRDNYKDGNVFYAYQLMGYEGNPIMDDKTGSIKLEVTFGTAVTKQVIGICLAQSRACMTIDKNLSVELVNQGIL